MIRLLLREQSDQCLHCLPRPLTPVFKVTIIDPSILCIIDHFFLIVCLLLVDFIEEFVLKEFFVYVLLPVKGQCVYINCMRISRARIKWNFAGIF